MENTETSKEDIIGRGVRDLPCKLTDEEFTRIAKTRVTKEAERDELADELKREKKKREDQIEELDDEIMKMRRELHSGFQERTVKVMLVFRKHPEDGTSWVYTLRTDTNAEVERRPATAHEMQRYLPGTEAGTTFGGGVLDQARSAQAAEGAPTTDHPDPNAGVPDGLPSDDDADESADESETKPKRNRKKAH